LLYLAHQSIVTLDHSPGEIVQLEFDPRGEFLAVVDSQGALSVWNWLEERRMSGFADATTRVTSIAFDPAGERLAAVISGAAVRVWRTRDGAELFRLGELGATTVAFSRDGRLLATAETPSHVVRVWDGVDGRPHSVLEGHTRNVQRLAFTEDARRLIGQNSAEAFVWDLETGQSLASYRVHDPVAVTLAIDPNGQHLVTIDGQGWVTLWTPSRAPEVTAGSGALVTLDPANPAPAAVQKRLIRIVSVQPELVRWARFSSDGRWLCHGGDNGTARVWDVGTGEEALVIPTRVYSATFAADGEALLTCGALTTASVWEITRRERVKNLRGHDALVGRGTFSRNRRFAATADRNGQVRIWNAGPGRELKRQRSWARGATLSRDGQWLAVSESGLALHVFDTRSGARRTTLQPQWLEAFYHLDFSPDGDRLVATGTQKSAKVFDLMKGALMHRLGGHQRQVLTVRYSPDGTRIATGSLDGTVRLWQAVNGTLEQEIRIGLPGLRCNLAFSPDGQHPRLGRAFWNVDSRLEEQRASLVVGDQSRRAACGDRFGPGERRRLRFGPLRDLGCPDWP
jgi:WD40 repeat protein